MAGISIAAEPVWSEAPLPREEILRQSFALAVTAHDAGQLEEAEKLYRAILAVDPAHADALHGLGVIAHAVGRGDIAEQLMRKALAQRPDPTFHNNLGLVLLALDRPHEALASIYRALEQRPAYPEACNALGNVQEKLGCRDEALASYRKALTLRPDYPAAQVNCGKTLIDLAELDQATECFKTAIALKPDSPKRTTTLAT